MSTSSTATDLRTIGKPDLLFLGISLGLLVLAALVTTLAGAPQGIVMLVTVIFVDLFFYAHASMIMGRKAATIMFLIGIIGAFLFEEFIGLRSGLYEFTELMGPKIDRAPLAIGFSWMAVFYMGWFMANLACDGAPSPRRNSIPRVIAKAFVAAFIVSAVDLAADPVSVEAGLWVWYDGGPFYGVPYSNYTGWIFVGGIILSIIGIVNRKNSDESIDFAPLSAKIWTIAPLVSFFFIGVNYIVGNYAGTMSIIELYAMGATFGIALFKWVDWIQGYPAPKRIEKQRPSPSGSEGHLGTVPYESRFRKTSS